jgi:hypothetical protein
MTIVFLDFDGVLHPDPCRDHKRLFEHAPRLAAALAPFARVAVVLSTSWRTEHGAQALAAQLPPTLRDQVVGSTRALHQIDRRPALAAYRRQAECLDWIDREQPGRRWFALDDRPDQFEPYCDRLIATDGRRGLDETTLNRLCFLLAQAAHQDRAQS